ncbi:MAG: AIM24 family protein [Caldilineaceae bacterium]
MQYRFSGEIAQSVRFDFEPGEFVWASKGSLMAYSPGVAWSLRLPGGLGGAVRRSLSGEGVTLTYLETNETGQYALLAANAPGHLELWDLQEDGPVTTTRGSFLAAWGSDIDITVTVARRAGAAIFGGVGLFLQQISGVGKVLIHGSGDFDDRRLGQGEQVLVSTGNLAAFSSVDHDTFRAWAAVARSSSAAWSVHDPSQRPQPSSCRRSNATAASAAQSRGRFTVIDTLLQTKLYVHQPVLRSFTSD